jgi:hypothetical protein
MAEVRAIGAVERYGGAGVLERAEWDLDALTALPVSFDAPTLDFEVTDPVEREAPVGQAVTIARVLVAACLLLVALAAGVVVLGPALGTLVVVVSILASVGVYRFVVQPWHLRWGATDAEVSAAMAGDELLEHGTPTTRAVTIDAPVAQVWSWLVERGIGPGGWSTRGLVDDGRLGGARIAPLIRNLGAGGTGSTPGDGFEVHRIDAPQTIVSRGPGGTSWCLQLRDAGCGRTRLVSRFRSQYDLVPGRSIVLADPVAFLQERRMLLDLKALAERGAPLPRHGCPVAP